MKHLTKLNVVLTALLVLAIAGLGIFPPAQSAKAASDIGFNGTSAKTAAYSILAVDNGTTFTNRGASGSVTLTLPAPFANAHYRMIVFAAQSFVVASDVADTFVLYNDATADSIASNTVGATIDIWSDGTSWFGNGTSVGVTYTIVTN